MAKAAIKEWQHSTVGIDPKRIKVHDSETEQEEKKKKIRLVEELTQRDAGVVVLRNLLKDMKEKPVSGIGGNASQEARNEAASSQSSPSQVTKVDYSNMSLQALQRIDKARDSTV